MHNKKSKKLPIRGDNHSYKISELTDVKYHATKAEEHYKDVKQRQCIIDYNAAVDDLSNLYDSIMHAREAEIDLNASLQKAKKVEQELNTSLQEVRSKIKEMDADVERARN